MTLWSLLLKKKYLSSDKISSPNIPFCSQRPRHVAAAHTSMPSAAAAHKHQQLQTDGRSQTVFLTGASAFSLSSEPPQPSLYFSHPEDKATHILREKNREAEREEEGFSLIKRFIWNTERLQINKVAIIVYCKVMFYHKNLNV